ncbi:MAG: type II secretion system protein [Acetatifactor sp.]
MKMFERLQAKKKDNKGFSLVELIIVIAIMAILVGVVGTQVVPYLNKSKVAKDQQLLSAFATAAVSAYSYKADQISSTDPSTITFDYFATTADEDGTIQEKIKAEMATLVSYSTNTALQDKMSSADGKALNDLVISLDQSGHTVTVSIKTHTANPHVPDAEATL